MFNINYIRSKIRLQKYLSIDLSNRNVLFDIKRTKISSKHSQCDEKIDFSELCRKSVPKQKEKLGKTNTLFIFEINKETKLNNKYFYFNIVKFLFEKPKNISKLFHL